MWLTLSEVIGVIDAEWEWAYWNGRFGNGGCRQGEENPYWVLNADSVRL